MSDGEVPLGLLGRVRGSDFFLFLWVSCLLLSFFLAVLLLPLKLIMQSNTGFPVVSQEGWSLCQVREMVEEEGLNPSSHFAHSPTLIHFIYIVRSCLRFGM